MQRTKHGQDTVSALLKPDHRTKPNLLPRLPKPRTQSRSAVPLCWRERSATQPLLWQQQHRGKGHQGLESTGRKGFPGRHAEKGSLAKPRKVSLIAQQYLLPVILLSRTFMHVVLECFGLHLAKHKHLRSASTPILLGSEHSKQFPGGTKSEKKGH